MFMVYNFVTIADYQILVKMLMVYNTVPDADLPSLQHCVAEWRCFFLCIYDCGKYLNSNIWRSNVCQVCRCPSFILFCPLHLQDLADVLHEFCIHGQYIGNTTVAVSLKTQRLACLTLGGLLASMKANGAHAMAQEITSSLHSEIGLHGKWHMPYGP